MHHVGIGFFKQCKTGQFISLFNHFQGNEGSHNLVGKWLRSHIEALYSYKSAIQQHYHLI